MRRTTDMHGLVSHMWISWFRPNPRMHPRSTPEWHQAGGGGQGKWTSNMFCLGFPCTELLHYVFNIIIPGPSTSSLERVHRCTSDESGMLVKFSKNHVDRGYIIRSGICGEGE